MKRSLERAAAAMSAGAALIHAAEAPEHFAEWWGYGAFFVGAAVAQAAFAILLVGLRRGGAPALRARGRRPSARWLLTAGIIGNAAIVAMYAVTRTIGIPLVGPEAGEVEPVTRSGLVATALELLLIAVLTRLLRVQDPAAASVDARSSAPTAGE